MKKAALFTNGRSQAVRIPKEFEFEGVSEVEITREGDALVLRPARKTWTSFARVEKADPDFLIEREDVIEDGRVAF
ncbi:type II toxin-antitoxin system VapB family antitoxin [Aliidiomarina sanyensis]|uniref:AbrB family transcriptional regulator n=1 Tax=Aliidiomarina sanyensis TaxID=1249555 RepID=A0A432WNS2_9GAMM|nr:type II toxin-antitoxin system VapB family antitoxin [Aliidiomarina sanyensis]RUO35443.1 AbrB family transcriptional regulator [Aliidiomarina sanyensis]